MSSTAPNTSARWPWLLIPLLLAGAGIAVWFFVFRSVPVVVEEVDSAPLIEARNLAISYLENEKFEEALVPLRELAKKRPDDSFAFRNLIVLRLLQFQSRNVPNEETIAETLLTLDRLKPLDATADYHRLASRVYRATGDSRAAERELRTALEQQSDDPSLWYEAYRLQDESGQSVAATKSLKTALQLDPDNVAILLDLLPRLSVDEADEFAAIVDRTERTLLPSANTIEKLRKQDVPALFQKMRTAFEANDQRKTSLYASNIRNLFLPEPIRRSDLRRLERNPLEFVQFDFQPPLDTDLEPSLFTETTPTSWETHPWEMATEDDPLPTGIREISAVDFDLDGADEVALLTDAELVICKADAGTNRLAPAWRFDMRVDRILWADLDGDFDAKKPIPGNPAAHFADFDAIAIADDRIIVCEHEIEEGERTLTTHPLAEDDQMPTGIRNVCLFDAEHDGDLDLLVLTETTVSLWLNTGAATFEPARTPIEVPANAFPFTDAIALDVDRDVDQDVYLFGNQGGILENLRHGQFRWRGVEAFDGTRLGLTFDDPRQPGWSAITSSAEGVIRRDDAADGALPFLGEPNVLASAPADRLATFDADLNGIPDLLAVREEGITLHPNCDENSSFISQAGGSLAVNDIDGDGDDDLLSLLDGSPVWIENEGKPKHAYLAVRAIGEQERKGTASPSGRTNHYGIGGVLEAKIGPRTLRKIIRSPVTRFGLGDAGEVDAIRILWTTGIPQNIVRPKTNQIITELQALKGSCPYLYTWDGEQYVFATDLLWAAPIGLQFADGVLAPCRPWEYLKLSGDLLKPIDGEYRLQITEELWEAAYFDHVELIAVDRPIDIDFETNEKVGPPSVAEPKLHPIRTRHRPVSITNGRGDDLSEELGTANEVYAKTWRRRLRQGLVDDHVLELDLGDAARGEDLTLFLRGWVFPTDTSLNVAMSHDPTLTRSAPPSLWVLNDEGEWSQVIPYIGFPGGKTKTIAVALDDVFPADNRRLQIRSNMELRWDAVWFTVDEEPYDFLQTPLELIAADLHPRGISETIPHPLGGPDRYDYGKVSTDAAWPPMEGSFTRFGDVTPLVETEDDRLVILGAGDEMTLRFRSPGPVPPGHVREFVLHNVGYDKDADLNTVTGQTVLPLPFRGMTGYPPDPEESPANRERIESDLRIYHTRRQLPQRFWRD